MGKYKITNFNNKKLQHTTYNKAQNGSITTTSADSSGIMSNLFLTVVS